MPKFENWSDWVIRENSLGLYKIAKMMIFKNELLTVIKMYSDIEF